VAEQVTRPSASFFEREVALQYPDLVDPVIVARVMYETLPDRSTGSRVMAFRP
jgi:hypothetical protein